jgi:hypothetical protein
MGVNRITYRVTIRRKHLIGRIEIDEAKRNRIMDKAGHLADEIGMKYMACAPGTFAGICDAFRSEDIELFTPEVQEAITQSMIGLHGGVAMTGVGTCGAATAAVFLISYVVGVPTKKLEKDGNLNYAAAVPSVEYVIDRFEEVYGALDCLRLRYNRVQRALDLMDPDARILEMTFALQQKDKCGMISSKFEGGRDQPPPVQAAYWAVEAICDLLELEPEERWELPPHLRGLGPQEMMPKLQKLVDVMNQMNYGRPNEKISYRDYRKLKLLGKKGLEKERLGSLSAPETE